MLTYMYLELGSISSASESRKTFRELKDFPDPFWPLASRLSPVFSIFMLNLVKFNQYHNWQGNEFLLYQ